MPMDARERVEAMVTCVARRWRTPDTALLRPLFPMLAEGRPVPVARLARGVGRDPATLGAALGFGRTERDRCGNVIELFGVGLAPTRHRVTIGDVALFTCCALVAQMLAPLLDTTLTVESVAPLGNRLVRLVVSPEGLEAVEPRGAAGTLVDVTDELIAADVRAAFCDHVCLLPDRDVAAEFSSADPRRYVVGAAEFHAASRRLWAAVWSGPGGGASGFPPAALLAPRVIT